MSKRTRDEVLKELQVAKAAHTDLDKKIKGGDNSEANMKAFTELEAKITELSAELKGIVEAEKAAIKPATTTEANEGTEPTETVEKGYVVPEGEEHLVHAELLLGNRFDPKTGKEIGKPFVQKFSVNEFKQFNEKSRSLGYAVKVLFEPSK